MLLPDSIDGGIAFDINCGDGSGGISGSTPALEGVGVVIISRLSRSGGAIQSVVLGSRDAGNGIRDTGTAVGIVGQGVLRQCHFTGGDGEVDGDILVIAILDCQGRGTVEGIVVFTRNSFVRGVDLDGVGLGVGVSGGVAYLFFVFFEILKIPFDGSAGDCRRGHAGRQRVADRAAGKAGGDLFGNIAESII